MSKNSKSDSEKLGHDPLEWLQEEDSDDVQAVSESQGEDTPLELDIPSLSDEEPEPDNEIAATAEEDKNISESAAEPDVADENAEQTVANSIVADTSLTVQFAEAFHQQLLSSIAVCNKDTPLVVDVSEVGQIDSSGYQLLLSACMSCGQKGIGIQITGASSALSEQLELLGDSTLSRYMESIHD
ncbi:STAS domain-containing protein [Alteromonas facilis]|uniref:STAS domain-containing protein n=1 Tax=Alteromonas facilis TaxID=2048004 RepID=UPI0013DD784B|nr:STAS domain-containing protein [Alteromonas facilis]